MCFCFLHVGRATCGLENLGVVDDEQNLIRTLSLRRYLNSSIGMYLRSLGVSV